MGEIDAATRAPAQPVRHGVRLLARQRFGATWGWARLLLAKNWAIIAGTALSIIGVLGLGVDTLGSGVIAVVLAVIGLIPLVSDWIDVRQELRDLYTIDHPVPDVVLDGDWEVVRCAQGRVVTSPSIDRSLDRPFVLESRPYVLPPDLAAIKPAVIALARSQRARTAAPPFDGLNIRLGGDPDPAGGEVHLQQVRYFDMMASNYLAGQQWLSRRMGRVVADITRHLVAGDGRLIPLSDTELGNQVGVSTVALTSDGWMLLVHQGVASRSSAGLVAPSGSGSLEPVDLAGRDRLPDAIAAGMERELREELGLVSTAMRDVRIETEVLGYGRWLEKGAKPEFYGVSRIHAAMRDLDVRIDLSERQFVSKHVRLRPADVQRLLAGAPFESLAQGVPSVPLELCLTHLRTKLGAA
ncbi:hypothetical protein EV646_115121 [Kribbella antiqua]|uniref:Nudix hydrolase domain-containing protein n=1 Tax=Kribbella antiqua TaxID=2512217 RepID=A0A4V2S2S2_9ACTN|nr:hypothetical protein [Kribbella antiqua]TCO41580.1 hypothetical protein EV646_115121 [Kribbella antiqua]